MQIYPLRKLHETKIIFFSDSIFNSLNLLFIGFSQLIIAPSWVNSQITPNELYTVDSFCDSYRSIHLVSGINQAAQFHHPFYRSDIDFERSQGKIIDNCFMNPGGNDHIVVAFIVFDLLRR